MSDPKPPSRPSPTHYDHVVREEPERPDPGIRQQALWGPVSLLTQYRIVHVIGWLIGAVSAGGFLAFVLDGVGSYFAMGLGAAILAFYLLWDSWDRMEALAE